MTNMYEPAWEEGIIKNKEVQKDIVVMVVRIVVMEFCLRPNRLKMVVVLEPGRDE